MKLRDAYVGKSVEIQSAALHCVDQVAIVLDISAASSQQKTSSNAFGESAQETAPNDTFLTVSVRCQDGAITKSTYSEDQISHVMSLTESREVLAQRRVLAEATIRSLVGTNIYPIHGAVVFSIDSSLEELASRKRPIPITSALQPLHISDAKILSQAGQDYAAYKVVDEETHARYFVVHPLKGFRPGDSLLDSFFIASLVGYSALDQASARGGNPLPGMSAHTLYAMWGIEEKDNDYGNGGHQLIYERSNEKVIVYTSSDGIVTDVQRFPE